jgi:probable F420-dependent oxidoreductase
MTHRSFRFGLTVGGAPSRSDLVTLVRRAEASGFDVLATADHLTNRHAVFPFLATVAQISSLRLGSLVVANDYRHPVVTARDAATIDILSEGRFELGIGTGWIRDQYASSGLPYDDPRTRVDRLEEAVQIIKGCWSGDPYTFTGHHYRVEGVTSPRPAQQPHPPLLLAGSGKRVLSIAARHGDIVGISPLGRGVSSLDDLEPGIATSGDRIGQQLEWVKSAAGSRFDSLELNVVVHHVEVTDDRDGALSRLAVWGATPHAIGASPHVLIGGAGEIAELLLERRERYGITYVVFPSATLDAIEPVVMGLAGT